MTSFLLLHTSLIFSLGCIILSLPCPKMAGFSFSCCWCLINPPILFSLPSESPLFLLPATRRRGGKIGELVVSNAHSNPKIINPKKKSRYGQTLSPYDSDEEAELDDESDDDDDDWLLNDDFAEVTEYENNKPKSQKTTIAKKGVKKEAVKTWETDEDDLDNASDKKKKKVEKDSWRLDGRGKVSTRKHVAKLYPRLSEEIDIDPKWVPLLDYLSTFGLKESHFVQMYERHMPSLQINVLSAQERLDYLLSVGVKHRDIKRMLLRQPQILQYTVENNLKAHISFLMGLGIPNSKIGQIVAVTPSLFSYSVENSLRPTIRYLIEEVGINENDVGKVVQLSPQILVQRLDITWNTRYMFLSKELGAPRDSVVKMVKRHPQILHYSIDDGFLPRINFLRSIGMCNSDILKVLTSLTQVLSLSLEDNLKPKYMYLVNELKNEVHILTKYPMYLSLSLDQRIRPRHRFLVELKKVRKGPFPLSSLVPNDESFCQQWAGTSVDKYLAFRQRLLLKDFANKYEKRG